MVQLPSAAKRRDLPVLLPVLLSSECKVAADSVPSFSIRPFARPVEAPPALLTPGRPNTADPIRALRGTEPAGRTQDTSERSRAGVTYKIKIDLIADCSEQMHLLFEGCHFED